MAATHDPNVANDNDNASANLWHKKFSWPMRLFLFCFVADMVVRSLLSLTNCDNTWAWEYDLPKYPLALPTPAELDEIAAQEKSHPIFAQAERLWQSVASVGPFLSPIPSAETAAKLKTPVDAGKYAITWTVTRLGFIGRLVGVDQDWPMFSPNVTMTDTLGRLRLVYADGSSEIHRHAADPEDLTCYCHWFEEKPLQVALKIHRDEEVRLGYCNWLVKNRPANDVGSPLVRIDLFTVSYAYPSPADDAPAFLKAQTGPPRAQQGPTFWVYDVATRTGKYVE